MPIPNRTGSANYHYHAYMYQGDTEAAPYAFSNPVATRNNYVFYSLRQDLKNLVVDGKENRVPNIELLPVGNPILIDGNTYNTLALRFGNRNNNKNLPNIILTGGIHAREWIAPEITYLIAEYLVKNYSQNPVGVYQTALSNLIDSRNIYIIPMLNPAGNWYTVFSSERNSRLWRKNRRQLPQNADDWKNAINHPPFQNVKVSEEIENGVEYYNVNYNVPNYTTGKDDNISFTGIKNPLREVDVLRGVDCNRNFNTPAWGYETKPNREGQPRDNTYFGTDRNSETENQNLAPILDGLCEKGVSASIDYHSYGQLIITPTEAAVSINYQQMGVGLQALTRLNGSQAYVLGDGVQTTGYQSVSSVQDFMSCVYQSRAFTIELDPSLKDPGFKLPQQNIMGVFEKNIRGALMLMAIANNNDHYANAQLIGQFLDWNVADRGNQLPA